MKDLEPYIPDLGIDYPERPDEHILPIGEGGVFSLGENYPFLDTSIGFRVKSVLLHLAIFALVFLISPIRLGLRIKGRRNLWKYRRLLRNGALAVSNHVHRWDLLCVLQALRYRRLYFPTLQNNLAGSDAEADMRSLI